MSTLPASTLTVKNSVVPSLALLAAWTKRHHKAAVTKSATFHLDGYSLEGFDSILVPAIDATLKTKSAGGSLALRLSAPEIVLPAAAWGVTGVTSLELGSADSELVICDAAFAFMPDLVEVTLPKDRPCRLGGLAIGSEHHLLAVVLASRKALDTCARQVFGGCRKLKAVSISQSQLRPCTGHFSFTPATVDLAGIAIDGPDGIVYLGRCLARLWASSATPAEGSDTLAVTLRNALAVKGEFVVHGIDAAGTVAEATPRSVAQGMRGLHIVLL